MQREIPTICRRYAYKKIDTLRLSSFAAHPIAAEILYNFFQLSKKRQFDGTIFVLLDNSKKLAFLPLRCEFSTAKLRLIS